MNEQRDGQPQIGLDESPTDERLIVKWLESQNDQVQIKLAQTKFEELLANAAQPRHASVNACIKLCYFIEQCLASKSASIKGLAFSYQNCVDLFNFYIDWNEKNQSRSMRQVLELVSTLITKIPDATKASAIKSSLIERILSIFSYQGSQALIKPAFKSLEYLLSKRTISTEAFIEAFRSRKSLETDSALTWDIFFLEVFEWMALQDVAPAAGKFIVTVFRQMRSDPTNKSSPADTISWQKWIRAGLRSNPQVIENVKNYVFLPLFKLDRPSSLVFLGELNDRGSVVKSNVHELDYHALLQLAAIEVGKKAGLIEEPSQFRQTTKKVPVFVALKEDTISVLLSNSSDTVRSLAFSVMASSSSAIRPFSVFALKTLQTHLSTLYSDTDAKFRNEVLSNSKHMIERLRGATGFLVREVETMRAKLLIDKTSASPEVISVLEEENLLLAHKTFIEWYFGFLLEELIPTTSYQRHITALKALELLLRSGILYRDGSSPAARKADNDTIWPFHYKFFDSNSMRLLLDLLMDPFEDVRNGATTILKLASPIDFNIELRQNGPEPFQNELQDGLTNSVNVKPLSRIGGVAPKLLNDFIFRAEKASKLTGRADYADGVARSYDLLYSLQGSAAGRLEILEILVNELESKIIIAETDLGKAVLEAPVHGQFAGLSLVWDSIDLVRDFGPQVGQEKSASESRLEGLQQRAVDQCRRIWLAVREILCNDSPEGHLPQEIDETESVDTKDVLSYSFRAAHESSNLMRMMINKLTSGSKGNSSLVAPGVFAQIGDLTFEQLSSLRHRGAFATVTLTFSRCCVLTQIQDPIIEKLLEKWYQGALNCIFDQVSTTRRSAGIPALLTSIMGAHAKEPAFEDIVSKLKSIARQPAYQSATDETSLPQVHAMNSLKETFKSSVLGRRAESHIGDCLQIAVDSLRSEIWAIRNCGLLLLRSLIDCLFGTSDSKMAIEAGWDGKSIKISYDKYPTLPNLLIKLLSEEVAPTIQGKSDISSVESVFPALDIVRRAGPPNTSRDEIYELVKYHLGSRVWNVREMAAHAMSVLVPQDRWAEAVRELLEMQKVPTNLRHGALMAVKFILERQSGMDPESASGCMHTVIPSFVSSFVQDSSSICPEIFTAHLEARNAVGILITRKMGELDGSNPSPMSLFAFDQVADFLLLVDDNFKYATWHPTCIALARRAICSTVLLGEYVQLSQIFRHAMSIGVDVILAALDYIPGPRLAISPEALSAVCQAYVFVIVNAESSEVRATALGELFAALSSTPRDLSAKSDDIFEILAQLICAQDAPKRASPAVQNALLEISGWLLLTKIHMSHGNSVEDEMAVRLWVRTLSLAGKKTEDFDTRMAAAIALDSFYANMRLLGKLPSDTILPCHLALYDCLNDDDSEIREVAAKTYSSWTSKSLMPLAAQQTIANTLLDDHASHPLLLPNVVSRLSGSLDIILSESGVLESPGIMFEAALSVDNTLFVEEDQNLYIDEVREVKFWKDIFERFLFLDFNEGQKYATSEVALLTIISWTADAVNRLVTIDKLDGVLGWTSKPTAFSACMRTIECANTLLNMRSKIESYLSDTSSAHGLQKIATGIETITARAAANGFHETLLVGVVHGNIENTLTLYERV